MDGLNFNLYNMNDISSNAGFNCTEMPAVNSFNMPLFDFSNSFAMSNPFGGFNNDFMASTMSMFNNFLMNPMAFMFQTNFNTKTNLAQLKNVYNPERGNALANIAQQNAAANNTRGKCLKGVRQTLNKAGLVGGSMGNSAYQAADVLARNKNFKEVQVSRDDLKNLPAGCVIVWDRNYVGTKSSDVHGHIAVTLGNGKEASDHLPDKTYMLRSSHRVFVPVGGINHSA